MNPPRQEGYVYFQSEPSAQSIAAGPLLSAHEPQYEVRKSTRAVSGRDEGPKGW